jgi:hypothetical protein
MEYGEKTMSMLIGSVYRMAAHLFLASTAVTGIPCTGDDFPMYTWLAVMSLTVIALIAAVIYFLKSMKK